jgi:hypothetical protein
VINPQSIVPGGKADLKFATFPLHTFKETNLEIPDATTMRRIWLQILLQVQRAETNNTT